MNSARPLSYILVSGIIFLTACAPLQNRQQKLANVSEASTVVSSERPVNASSSPSASSYADDDPKALMNMLDPSVTDIETAFQKAEQEKRQGKNSRALFYYVKALQFDRQNIHALENIAAIHQQNKDEDKALRIYQDILTIDADNLVANEQLGLSYLQNRLKQQARKHLGKVIEKDGKHWKAHNGLGIIADLDKQYDKAIEHYQAALEGSPSNPMLLNNIGYSHYLKGDYSTARNYFNQALSFDHQYQRAIYNLALLEVKNGQYAAAVTLFNRVMKSYESYNNVGYLCMLDGKYDVADEYFRKAINESPVYFPKAEANLQQLDSLR